MTVSSNMRARALCAAASTIAIGAGALALPSSAFAATQSGGTSVGEVIVTAQKRSENLQKIPLAVTAFTAQQRDQSGIVSAQQQLNFTPGVTYDPSTDHLDIRGVGRVTTLIGTDPGVAVYQDGFYVGTASQLNQSTLLAARTEVLRGPQGTLYGRNSIGGAVNVISRRPDDEYTGEIRAGFSDYHGETLEARVSGPVTDWLKLSAYFQQFNQTGNYYSDVPPHTAPSTNSQPADQAGGFPPLPAYPAATCDSLNFASVQPLTCNEFKGRPGWGGGGRGWVADFQASFSPSPLFDGWVKANFNESDISPQGAPGITPWDPINLTVPSVFYGFQGPQDPGVYNMRNFTSNLPNTQKTSAKQFITQDTFHGPGFDVKFIGGFWETRSLFQEDGDAVPISPSGIYSPTFFGSGMAERVDQTGAHFSPDYPVYTAGPLAGQPIGNIFNPFTGMVVPNPVATPTDPSNNTVVNTNNLTVIVPSQQQAWSTELNISSTDKGPFQWLFGLYYYNENTKSDFTYQELSTTQYDHVTDYLFNAQQSCFPVVIPIGGVGVNINQNPGTGVCPLGGFGLGYLGDVFGYHQTTPSTLDNRPGGAVDKAFGLHGGDGAGCLYCFNARLKTQSEAVFAQIDWRPNDQWHFTLGARYSGDQKQGFEQETDIFWIPLVATQDQAQALGFPVYPSDWPDPGLRGKYVQDYVGTSCSTPGLYDIKPYQEAGGGKPEIPCPAHRNLKHSWAAPTGTVGLEWTPTPETNVYVRYNRGYKSGGFNLGQIPAPGIFQKQTVEAIEVQPEYIDDFEGGWKQNFGRTLQFNVAGFYYLYHGLQALNATTQASSPPIQINELVNIAQAHVWGIELETKWSPIENLLIGVNYSYLNTTNDSDCKFTGANLALAVPGTQAENCFVDSADPSALPLVNHQSVKVQPAGPYTLDSGGNVLQGQSLKGNPLPYSPTHKVGVNVAYTFKFEPGDLTLAAVYNWHSSFYDNLFSTNEWLVPGGDTADFRVTWNGHGGRYQIIGTVENAFNNNVWTAYTTLPPGNAYYAFNSLQPPRIFRLELRYKF